MRDDCSDEVAEGASRQRSDAWSRSHADSERHETAELLSAITQAVSAMGYDATRCRVAGVFRVCGPLVDDVCGDVLFERGGWFAIVEPQAAQAQGGRAHQFDDDDVGRLWPGEYARLIMITLAHGSDRDATVWIL